MNAEERLKIITEWNSLKSDLERLQYVKDHKDILKVVLDNDGSWIQWKDFYNWEEVEDDPDFNSFDDYFGWDDGVHTLFKFIGIDAENC